jgi:hypothetical protein
MVLEGEIDVRVGTGAAMTTLAVNECVLGVPSGVETANPIATMPRVLVATLTVNVSVLVPVRPAIEAELVQVIVCPVAVQVQPGVVEVYDTKVIPVGRLTVTVTSWSEGSAPMLLTTTPKDAFVLSVRVRLGPD